MTETVTEEVKSVDILAALPTPPHNQNEDIRYCELNLHIFFFFASHNFLFPE